MLKKILIVFALIVIIGLALGSKAYQYVYGSNVKDIDQPIELLILPGEAYSDVLKKLEGLNILEDMASFEYVADLKSYPELVKSGRYVVESRMSNNQLINMLRIGEQTPVKLSFNNVRTIPELAGKVSRKLAGDSLLFHKVLTNDSIMRHYGFSRRTYISMFIPNTYEFYWNTSPEKFIERMAGEFKKFWTDARLAKARALGLTQSEVVTLASIVQAEQTVKFEEHKTIAGLYINRIRKGIALQSDPTVKFAVGDFGLKRVLNVHLKSDSPYNTYKHPGLPPGPICMPDIRAVDAVLNYEKHSYIFMCAKADFSGFHHFTANHREHSRYAKAYRKALDDNKIYR